MFATISRRTALATGLGLAACGATSYSRERIWTDADPYSEELKSAVEPRPVPYAAKFVAGGESLLYVAAQHEIYRSSRTFQLVEEGFREFKPKLLVVEGFPTAWGRSPQRVRDKIRGVADTTDEYQGGENLFACSLAMRSDIAFMGGEPEEIEVAKRLEALGFRQRDIFGTDVLRFLPQSKRAGGYPEQGKPTLAEIVRIVNERSFGLHDDQGLTADDFRAWYLKTFGRVADTDPDLLSRAYPSGDNKVGSILLREAQMRDTHALGIIRDCLNTAKRVMTVYGGGHLVTQWHALTKAMGQPTIKG